MQSFLDATTFLLMLYYLTTWEPGSWHSSVCQVCCPSNEMPIPRGFGQETLCQNLILGLVFFYYRRMFPSYYRNVRHKSTMVGQILGMGSLGERGTLTRCCQQTWLLQQNKWSNHCASFWEPGVCYFGWAVSVCTAHEVQQAILGSTNWWLSSSLVGKLEDSSMNASLILSTRKPVAEWIVWREITCNLGAIFTFKMLLIMFNT